MAKSPTSMEYDPVRSSTSKEAPVQTAFKYLVTESGDRLQLMTRTNPIMVRACQVAYIFDKAIGYDHGDGVIKPGNDYVAGRVAQMMMLAVSMNGKGREEIIQALGEGGQVPDTYYGPRGRSTFEEIQ